MERTYQISGLNATFSYPIWETAEIEENFFELGEQWRRETGEAIVLLDIKGDRT